MMWHYKISSVLIFVLLLAVCEAHFNLYNPFPYNPSSCKISASFCKGACPPIYKVGAAKARNSPQNPGAVWKRGQTVTIDWHKNNHEGGFLRRSLVPVKYMFDHDWHKKTAFEFGCNNQQIVKCVGNQDKCGSDLQDRSYRNQMTIPDVFPDGDYVFGQAWYGGYDPGQVWSKYSDYFACAFVKISGGNPLKASHTATWTGPQKQCRSAKTVPLTCGGDGCGRNVPAIITVPDEFRGGSSSQVVRASLFGAEVMKHGPMKTEPVPGMEMSMAEMLQTTSGTPRTPVQRAAIMEQSTASGDTRVKTEPMSGNGLIEKVLVYVNFNVVAELRDGDSREIDLNGRPVSIEALAGRRAPRSVPVFFITEGEETWIESRPPYVWQGNVGTDVNNYKTLEQSFLNKNDGKPFDIEIVVYRNGKRYSMTVTLTLKV